MGTNFYKLTHFMKKILKKLISFIFRDRLIHDTVKKKMENIIFLMLVHFRHKEFLSLEDCLLRISKKWNFSHLLASQNGRYCCIHDPPIKYRRNPHLIIN